MNSHRLNSHSVWWVAVALLSGAAEARAQSQKTSAGSSQKVAVLRLEFMGSIPDAGRELFSNRLVEGLAAANFEVVAGSTVDVKLANQPSNLADCHDASCYGKVAEVLGVQFLIAGSVGENNKTYTISLMLIDGRRAATVANDNERCETCGIEEAAERMALAASALKARLESLTRAPARFAIHSRPPSANAIIDDKPLGTTPLDVELPSGRHSLRLSLEGHNQLDYTFTAVSGLAETLNLDLTPKPSPLLSYQTAAWVGIAAGVLAMVAGIWAVSADGHEITCANSEKDPAGHCPYVRSTGGMGAVLIGVGAAAASLGGVVLYLGGRTAPDSGAERASAHPSSPSSYGLALHRRF